MSERQQIRFCDNCNDETPHLVSGSGRKGSCEDCGSRFVVSTHELPYSFDLLYDIKTHADLKRVYAQATDDKKGLEELMTTHNIPFSSDENKSKLNQELANAFENPDDFDFGFVAEREDTDFANFDFDEDEARDMRNKELDRIAQEEREAEDEA